MCLAAPMKIVNVLSDELAEYELGGQKNRVNITMLDDVKSGEYVIVHAGFAIEKMNAEEAEATLELFRQIAEAGEES